MKFKTHRYTYRSKEYKEFVPFINGKAVLGGEGAVDIFKSLCNIHGETYFISGYNQGGHDSVSICLKCCSEIYNNLHLLTEPMEEITEYPKDEVENG